MTSPETPENTMLRRWCLAALLLAAAAFSGCASSDGSRSGRSKAEAGLLPSDDPAGSSAELVFSGIEVQRGLVAAASDAAYLSARNESRRESPESRSLASRVAYPEPEASSLDRLRTLYLLARPERVPYYRREHRRRD
jgi:hypothetical protein